MTVAAEPEEEPTKVVDLMEALKASVAEAKKKQGVVVWVVQEDDQDESTAS